MSVHFNVRAELADRLRLFRGGLFCCLRDALTDWRLADGSHGEPEDAIALGLATAADFDTCRPAMCPRAKCERGSLDSRLTLPLVDVDTGEEAAQ